MIAGESSAITFFFPHVLQMLVQLFCVIAATIAAAFMLP